MRLNSKNIVTLLALGSMLAFAPSLLAQPTPTNAPAGAPPAGVAGGGQVHGPNVDLMLQRLTTRLNLTPDEQAKVKPILENQMQQMVLCVASRRKIAGRKSWLLRQEMATNFEAILTLACNRAGNINNR